MNVIVRSAFVLALFAILIALLALAGWFVDMPVFYTFLSHGASMKFNTALAMLLLGSSVSFAVRNKRLSAGILGAIIVIFCVLTLVEYVYGIDLHIDQLFVVDDLTNSVIGPPGRMSLLTVISFLVITIGLELTLVKKYFTAQILVALGLL